MLNVFFGDMKEAVYNTAAYFKYDYEDSWIVDPFVKEMVLDVDQSVVLDSGVIDSPVLGKIPPTGLSGGVKTLILVKFDKDNVFNASTCGDNEDCGDRRPNSESSSFDELRGRNV